MSAPRSQWELVAPFSPHGDPRVNDRHCVAMFIADNTERPAWPLCVAGRSAAGPRLELPVTSAAQKVIGKFCVCLERVKSVEGHDGVVGATFEFDGRSNDAAGRDRLECCVPRQQVGSARERAVR